MVQRIGNTTTRKGRRKNVTQTVRSTYVVPLFSCMNGKLKIFYALQPRRRQWHPTPVLLPGKSHGWRSLVGCSPWGREESDTTEWLHFHFSLSCIGEGNGNPLQCSCLENPRDGGPCGLASMGLHRVGHDWSDLAAAAAAYYWTPFKSNLFEIRFSNA